MPRRAPLVGGHTSSVYPTETSKAPANAHDVVSVPTTSDAGVADGSRMVRPKFCWTVAFWASDTIQCRSSMRWPLNASADHELPPTVRTINTAATTRHAPAIAQYTQCRGTVRGSGAVSVGVGGAKGTV